MLKSFLLSVAVNPLAILVLFGHLVSSAAAESPLLVESVPAPIRFVQSEEIVRQWSPIRQLFVKGNIGVEESQLKALAEWLKVHGPHWTVVLMESADNQYYESSDGTQHYGMGAVEHALGYGLNNQASLSSLRHPTTLERDATIFVLFLRERQFSYYSSEAQDKRGLGKSKWIGGLDKAAINAMRNGRRVVDAVEDTVKSITGGLNRKIENEILMRKRAEQAVWALTFASIFGLIFAFLAFLWLLSRRRRPIRDQSIEEFRERERSVRRETDQIDTLFTRNSEILGSREKVEERGYVGRTKQVSEETFNYVDDLFIMSKEVNRVIEEARDFNLSKELVGKVFKSIQWRSLPAGGKPFNRQAVEVL